MKRLSVVLLVLFLASCTPTEKLLKTKSVYEVKVIEQKRFWRQQPKKEFTFWGVVICFLIVQI